MTTGPSFDRLLAELRRAPPPDPAFEARVVAALGRARRRRAALRAGGAPLLLLLALVLARSAASRRPTEVRFAVELPSATRVMLVGDFNDWERGRTPLARSGDRWEVTLPLRAGVYRFAYLVDGAVWTVDPERAAQAADPDFGEPVSLIAVR